MTNNTFAAKPTIYTCGIFITQAIHMGVCETQAVLYSVFSHFPSKYFFLILFNKTTKIYLINPEKLPVILTHS